MTQDSPRACTATPLRYEDEVLRSLDLPSGRLTVLRGVGSGLTRRPGDPASIFWAVGDRGPNLKVPLAIRRFGLADLARHAELAGAKVMPCPEIGPALSELCIVGDEVRLLRTLPLRDEAGRPLSGLPTPGTAHAVVEPAIALNGQRLPPAPGGADTEGIAAAPDGAFWIGDEHGPSLLHVAADGTVLARWVPEGSEALFAGAPYPVHGALPAIAARRQINRGFEGLALSADGAWLYLAFQSPLAHPDEAAHAHARHVRIWKLDAATGRVAAQFLYPLDPPESFARDVAKGEIARSDLKISELLIVGRDRLIVLERASATTKLYGVHLDPARALGDEHLTLTTRPTVEERSADPRDALGLPVLDKALIFTSDDHPQVDPDLEGLILLSPRTLLLVNDNDFGVEDVKTRFWRIDLPGGIAFEET